MKVAVLRSVRDDFNEMSGPSTVTQVSLSLDGMLFDLGRFYEGPHMDESTGDRLSKILEFEKKCDELFDA